MHGWRRFLHNAPVFAVGILSVVLCVLAWYLTAAAEDRAARQEFLARANNQSIFLQNGIDDYLDRIRAVRALFDASNHAITREEFETFTRLLLAGNTAILNIAWIPRVTREERAAHELAAARDGLPDYHIRSAAAASRHGAAVCRPLFNDPVCRWLTTRTFSRPNTYNYRAVGLTQLIKAPRWRD